MCTVCDMRSANLLRKIAQVYHSRQDKGKHEPSLSMLAVTSSSSKSKEPGAAKPVSLYPPGSLFQIVSIQIEQDKSEMLRKPGPERGITDIVGHISDHQAAGSIDHLSNELLLREGIDSVALLFARRRIDHGPDVFVLSNSQVSDMVIMVIQAAAGRLNMQVVMTG